MIVGHVGYDDVGTWPTDDPLPLRELSSIATTVDTRRQVWQTCFKALGVLVPRHVVDARCRLLLQVEEGCVEQSPRLMFPTPRPVDL